LYGVRATPIVRSVSDAGVATSGVCDWRVSGAAAATGAPRPRRGGARGRAAPEHVTHACAGEAEHDAQRAGGG
jgi:hypothetical protein